MKITAERIGIIIGVIGGIISIPKGAMEAYETFFAKPKLIIERSAPLTLTSDPKQKTLTLSFGLILQNKGNDSEAIERCSAYLGVPGDASRREDFSDPDIIFKSDGNQIPKNLPIQKGGDYRPITCEITSQITEPLRAIFNQHETQRQLIFALYGQANRSYSISFDFDFGSDIASTLLDPSLRDSKSLTFIGSNLQ